MTIKETLADALKELDISFNEISLEHPDNLENGDYASSVALELANKRGQDPREFANEIVGAIDADEHEYMDDVSVAGPGFINFTLSNAYFAETLEEIVNSGDDFGCLENEDAETIIVEYSSPNIAKPFTVGHLRSTIIGDAMANILEFAGYEVVRDNHLGDWGTQFGKLIVAIRRWGDIDEIKASEEPIQELVELYVKFHDKAEEEEELEQQAREWFKKLEEGDQQARELWQVCKDLSMEEFGDTYERLGVSFDTALGESFFVDKTDAVIELVKEKGVAEKSEGALLIFFKEDDDLPPLMIQKEDGSSLYATRDLATDLYRKEEYGDDITVINEVGSEQELYFRQLYRAEAMLGIFSEDQRFHLKHGLYSFKESKMSTREGNVIWLADILDEAVKKAAEFNPDVAEEVGIGAVKYNDLKREAHKNITFDWDEVLNLDGNSGPYLQYTYARTQSVLEKAKKAGKEPKVTAPEEVTALERYLYRFPEVVERAAEDHAPHYVCTYLHTLSQKFNAYYGEYPIIDSEEAQYRLALTQAVGQVLKNGLSLLGIEAVERM